MANDWSIIYYVEDNGKCPVKDFLSGLDDKTRARFGWSLERLRDRNVQAREPLVKHIDGKLYELREESNTNIYRIMYFFFTGRQIVLLHGFQKKSQKTPVREITMAVRRMDRFVERAKGDEQ